MYYFGNHLPEVNKSRASGLIMTRVQARVGKKSADGSVSRYW